MKELRSRVVVLKSGYDLEFPAPHPMCCLIDWCVLTDDTVKFTYVVMHYGKGIAKAN